jgi:ABC-type lipoprotein export system ATPase subunit
VSEGIEARNVFRVYETPEGSAAALQGLSLTIEPGEIAGVLGPSGSGKSTFLRLLAALDRPSAGTVRVFGADVAALSRRQRAEYRSRLLGYVEQHYWRSLDPHLGARELVALQLALMGVPRAERMRRADDMLARVGLGDRADARPAELSGGEQQRVAVCAAIAHRPRLLLADEPTGELDRENARVIYGLIAELAREVGCTTVVVTHDPAVAAIADRVVRVRDGRVSAERYVEDEGEEAIVVGQGGWLRLPEELLSDAGITTRARARLGEDGIVVSPVTVNGSTRADDARTPAPAAAASSMQPSPVAVEARRLTKVVGRDRHARTLFRDFTAEFPGGAVTAVTGPSGTGKTTLLHLLAGLARPTAGDVVALGTRLAGLDRAARADFRRAHVAFVSQQLDLVPFLTARENVELAAALRGAPPDEAEHDAREILEAIGLAERLEQRVARLSAGERQRVAVARALAARPRILLADEPTARLDEANALAVASLLEELAAEHGVAVVCGTHDRLLAEAATRELSLVGEPLARAG